MLLLDNTAVSPRLISFQGAFFPPQHRAFGTESRSLYSGLELGNPVREVSLDVRVLTHVSGPSLVIAEILNGERRSLFAMRAPSGPAAAQCAFALSTFLARHDAQALERLLSDSPPLWRAIAPETRDALISAEKLEQGLIPGDDLSTLSFLCRLEAEYPREHVPSEPLTTGRTRVVAPRGPRREGVQALCGGAIVRLETLENSFALTVRRAGASPAVPPFEALVTIQRSRRCEQEQALRALVLRCGGAPAEVALANLQELFAQARWRYSGANTSLTNPILLELRSEIGGSLPFFSSAWQSPRAAVPPRQGLLLLEDLLLGRERLVVHVRRFSRASLSQMELCLDRHANGTVILHNGDALTLQFRVHTSTFGGHGLYGITDLLSTFVPEPERLLNELFLRAEFVAGPPSPFTASHGPALCHALRIAEEFERLGSQPGCPTSYFASSGRVAPLGSESVGYRLRNGRGVGIFIEVGPHGPQCLTLERHFLGIGLPSLRQPLDFASQLDADFIRAFYGTRPYSPSCQALLSRAPSHHR